MFKVRGLTALALVSFLSLACGESATKDLAPTASGALASAAPKSGAAKELSVDKASSKVTFSMDAPVEKIRGRLSDAAEGKLFLDPSDLKQTTGNIIVDISKLELFQAVADDTGSFGEESKSEKQNEHAREWLEIASSAPEEIRKKNSRVEFRIVSIDSVSQQNVSQQNGEVRVDVKASGELLLHGRVSKKTVDLEVTLTLDAGVIKAASINTKAPFAVGLEEHDVRPRDTFGSLAQKTLSDLGQKVAREAKITFELVLVAPGAAAPAKPVETAAPEASASAEPEASGSAAPAESAPVPSTSAPEPATSAKASNSASPSK